MKTKSFTHVNWHEINSDDDMIQLPTSCTIYNVRLHGIKSATICQWGIISHGTEREMLTPVLLIAVVQ